MTTADEGTKRGVPASSSDPCASTPTPGAADAPTAAATEGIQAAAGMAAGRALIMGTVVVTAILVPRLMGPAQYGAYASIMALVAVLMPFSDSGIGWIEMRVLAPAWRGGRLSEACELASTTWTLRLILSALAGMGAALLLEASGGFGMSSPTVVIIGVMAAGRAVATGNNSLLLALGRRRAYLGVEFGRSVGALLAVLLGYSLLGLEGAFLGLLAMAGAASWLSHCVLRSVIPISPGRISRDSLRPHRRFMLWSAMGQLFGGGQFWLPLYLVGLYRAGSQAGYLAIAVQVLGAINAVAASARLGIMPILSELVAKEQREQLLRWGSLILRLSSVIDCLGLLLWLGMGRALVDLLWSSAYRPVFETIAMMLVAHVFLSAAAFFQSLMNLFGRAASASLTGLGFASVTLTGTALVLASGAEQAALWVACAHAVGAAMLALIGYLTLGLREAIWMPIGRASLPPLALAALIYFSGGIPELPPAIWAGAIALGVMALPMLGIVRVAETKLVFKALSGKRAKSPV